MPIIKHSKVFFASHTYNVNEEVEFDKLFLWYVFFEGRFISEIN